MLHNPVYTIISELHRRWLLLKLFEIVQQYPIFHVLGPLVLKGKCCRRESNFEKSSPTGKKCELPQSQNLYRFKVNNVDISTEKR